MEFSPCHKFCQLFLNYGIRFLASNCSPGHYSRCQQNFFYFLWICHFFIITITHPHTMPNLIMLLFFIILGLPTKIVLFSKKTIVLNIFFKYVILRCPPSHCNIIKNICFFLINYLLFFAATHYLTTLSLIMFEYFLQKKTFCCAHLLTAMSSKNLFIQKLLSSPFCSYSLSHYLQPYNV